jgi:hypothetical protein
LLKIKLFIYFTVELKRGKMEKAKISFLILFISTFQLFPQQENSKPQFDIFSFEKKVELTGTPEQVFDLATGDISGWWDHTFSDNPKKFFIEPKPGGGFYEIFDDEGNGVLHATVIYAHRGRMLRFEGPLGLSGNAVQMVTTYQFEPLGIDSTLMKVEVHAAGEFNKGLPAIVEKVWEHFIFERFKPYVENKLKKD